MCVKIITSTTVDDMQHVRPRLQLPEGCYNFLSPQTNDTPLFITSDSAFCSLLLTCRDQQLRPQKKRIQSSLASLRPLQCSNNTVVIDELLLPVCVTWDSYVSPQPTNRHPVWHPTHLRSQMYKETSFLKAKGCLGCALFCKYTGVTTGCCH